MVLSDRTILAEIEAERIVIDPFDENLVQPASVDVRVDRSFRVFHNARYPYIDVRQPMEDLTELVEIHDEERWQVQLRCPDCEHRREGVFSQKSVEAFDELLDTGTDALTADYRRLCRANMAEEVERFTTALESDALLPEDF